MLLWQLHCSLFNTESTLKLLTLGLLSNSQYLICTHTQSLHLHSLECFHTPAGSLRSSTTNLLTVSFACTRTALGARSFSVVSPKIIGILALQLCAPATVSALSVGTSRLVTSSKPFHHPTYMYFPFAPHIRHLLTLCAFIYSIYLLTYLLPGPTVWMLDQ